MNFDLDDVQEALVGAVATIFERFGAPEATSTERSDTERAALLGALGDAGYLDLYRSASPLEAALVVEEGARAAATAPIAARVLVAPALMDPVGVYSVALAAAPDDKMLVRYAPGAELVLVADGSEVVAVRPAPGEVETVSSPFGYPLGRLLRWDGESLGPDTAETLFRWWRVALAVETAACMREALRRTIAYVRDREMFGKTLGSYQAVQHRLSELHIRVEGRAGWREKPPGRGRLRTKRAPRRHSRLTPPSRSSMTAISSTAPSASRRSTHCIFGPCACKPCGSNWAARPRTRPRPRRRPGHRNPSSGHARGPPAAGATLLTGPDLTSW